MSNNPYYQAAELTTWQWKYVGGGGADVLWHVSTFTNTRSIENVDDHCIKIMQLTEQNSENKVNSKTCQLLLL